MRKKSMTLIEVVIALFIFAVGILAIIRVITTNITIIDTMKVKIQAQSLAKEGLDIIFNIRDTNLLRGTDRQCAFLSADAITKLKNTGRYDGQTLCGASFSPTTLLRVAVDPVGRLVVGTTTTGTDFASTFAINQLKSYSGTDYTGAIYVDGPATGTLFSRYISFAPVMQSGSALDTTKLLKVTSHVLYRKGSIKGEFVLESFIGAIKK